MGSLVAIIVRGIERGSYVYAIFLQCVTASDAADNRESWAVRCFSFCGTGLERCREMGWAVLLRLSSIFLCAHEPAFFAFSLGCEEYRTVDPSSTMFISKYLGLSH